MLKTRVAVLLREAFIDLPIVGVYNNFNGQSKLFVNEVVDVQIGELKRDIDVKYGKAKNLFGDYTEAALIKEGKKLYRKHPEYKYLEDDPWVEYYKKKENTDGEFYESVVYAYITDQVLKEHPEFKDKYEKIIITTGFTTSLN